MVTTPYLHRKSDLKRVTVRVRLVLFMLTLFQFPPSGHSHGANKCSKTYHFRDIATQSRFLGAPISLHCDFNAHLMLNSCNWHWKHVQTCQHRLLPTQININALFSVQKNGGNSEVRLGRYMLTWSQNPSCGHFLVQTNYSKTYYFRDIAVQNLLLSLQKPCIPTSMHPSCSNYEIIRFLIVKLTIPGGHDTSFASKIRPKARYGQGPLGAVHAYFVPTPTPWTFSWCKQMQQHVPF